MKDICKIAYFENGLQGMKDTTGKVIIPAKYDAMDTGDGDFLRICEHGKWGIIDCKGNVVVKPTYTSLYGISDGMAAAQKDGKFGYIDMTGKVVIPFEYEDGGLIYGPEDGYPMPVSEVQKEGKWGMIAMSGELIIPCKYDIMWFFADGYVNTETEDGSGVFDAHGKEVIPFEYEDLTYVESGIFIACKKGKYGLIDVNNQVILPFKYDDISGNTLDCLIVNNKDKYNIINREDRQLLDKWYDSIELLENGLVLLQKGSNYYYGTMPLRDLQKCQSDRFGIYDRNGETLLKIADSSSNKVTIRAGVQKLAKDCHESRQIPGGTTTLIFKEGVTTIGPGFEDFDSDDGKYNPQLVIYLPSTLRSADPMTFAFMLNRLRTIYVPKGCTSQMKSILPAYLASYVQEKPQGIFAWISGIWGNPSFESFMFNPYGTILAPIVDLFPKSWKDGGVNGLLYLILIVAFGLPGLLAYRDTLLSFHISLFEFILICAGLSAVIAYLVRRSKYRMDGSLMPLSIFASCAFGWFCAIAQTVAVILFLVFFVNKMGQGETRTMQGEIEAAWEHTGKSHYYSIDIMLPIAPYHFSKNIGNDDSYDAGMPCTITYHTGLWGLDVVDSVEH